MLISFIYESSLKCRHRKYCNISPLQFNRLMVEIKKIALAQSYGNKASIYSSEFLIQVLNYSYMGKIFFCLNKL